MHLRLNRQEGETTVVLTNYPGRPEDFGLFLSGQDLGIPVVGFQHGVCRELNADHGDLGVENACSHLTLVYNETAVERSNDTYFHHGRTTAVGFPAIGRRLSKHPAAAFQKTEPILYVATAPHRGYVHLVSSAATDLETSRFEIDMIEQVLDKAPRRVTYKPYPHMARYADLDPTLGVAFPGREPFGRHPEC